MSRSFPFSAFRMTVVVTAIVTSGFASTWSVPARAEYRAYKLVITNTRTGQTRTVLSTLDDIQYAAYHPVGQNETVTIQNTWMCWKRSDHLQPICPDGRQPASASTSSGTALPAGSQPP